MTASRTLLIAGLAGALPASLLAGSPLTAAAAPSPTSAIRADLRVDANRDGTVDVTGNSDAAKNVATPTQGAMVLPNIDDDSGRCAPLAKKLGKKATSAKLAACNDASDTRIDSAADARDLATVKIPAIPAATADTSAVLDIVGRAAAQRTHVFLKSGTGWKLLRSTDRLTAAQLRAGVELGVEATDIIRDPKVWDGTIPLRLRVTSGGVTSTDRAMMRVAPLVPQMNTDGLKKIYMGFGKEDTFNAATAKEIATQVKHSPGTSFSTFRSDDIWTQDTHEPMYAAIPKPGGQVSSVRVLVLSDQGRPAGGLFAMRGRNSNIGVAYQGKASMEGGSTYDSGGNIEALPAKAGHPFGRWVVGYSTKNDPDGGGAPSKRMMNLLTSQTGARPLMLRTGWLAVGHVDEFFHVIPAQNARGWTIAVADTNSALKTLRDMVARGKGNAAMMSHKNVKSKTVKQQLSDRTFVRDNAYAQKNIDANLRILKRETGLTDADIVRVPMLFTSTTAQLKGVNLPVPGSPAPKDAGGAPAEAVMKEKTPTTKSGQKALTAFYPGAVNSVMMNARSMLAPKTFGPVVGGKDVMGAAVARAYGSVGITLRTVDDFLSYKIGDGDVHCATNVIRDIDAKRALGRS